MSFVLEEIRQVTEIVTTQSQSLSRSRTSSTWINSSFSSSSASNMVKSFVLDEIRQGHGNRDVTVTCQVTREWDVISFLIFEFLNLQYGEIGIKIEFVAFVLEEIRQVTEIVTSVSLARSRAIGTSSPFLYLSSSTSNMVKSASRSSL